MHVKLESWGDRKEINVIRVQVTYGSSGNKSEVEVPDGATVLTVFQQAFPAYNHATHQAVRDGAVVDWSASVREGDTINFRVKGRSRL